MTTKYGGSKIHRNAGIYLQIDAASYPESVNLHASVTLIFHTPEVYGVPNS
jgi:hypothetical protein